MIGWTERALAQTVDQVNERAMEYRKKLFYILTDDFVLNTLPATTLEGAKVVSWAYDLVSQIQQDIDKYDDSAKERKLGLVIKVDDEEVKDEPSSES